MRDPYQNLLLELGDLARERLWNKPSCPKSMDRVYKAEEALEAHQTEVQAIEQQMGEQEQALAEFREACDAEFAEQEVLVSKFKKSVDAAEGKVKGLRSKLASREADLRYSKFAIDKEEGRVKEWDEIGEVEKAAQGKEGLKKMRMDIMRRQRELNEMREEMDKIMNPESGPGAEGIRARRRMMELEGQLDARDAEFKQAMGDLQTQLDAKQQDLAGAQAFYDNALILLGEDAYKARVADPALAALYPKLDKIARAAG